MVDWARLITGEGEMNYGKGINHFVPLCRKIVVIEGLVCLEPEIGVSKESVVRVLPKERN